MVDERAIILKLNSMTKLRTIVLEYDLIEIHHNKNLKNKPYLVRVFSYNNSDPHEIRLNETELKDLYKILKNYKYI
jgi:hypothetical protein